jgi:hypothetical protein
MPYSSEHREQTRTRIVDAARRQALSLLSAEV